MSQLSSFTPYNGRLLPANWQHVDSPSELLSITWVLPTRLVYFWTIKYPPLTIFYGHSVQQINLNGSRWQKDIHQLQLAYLRRTVPISSPCHPRLLFLSKQPADEQRNTTNCASETVHAREIPYIHCVRWVYFSNKQQRQATIRLKLDDQGFTFTSCSGSRHAPPKDRDPSRAHRIPTSNDLPFRSWRSYNWLPYDDGTDPMCAL